MRNDRLLSHGALTHVVSAVLEMPRVNTLRPGSIRFCIYMSICFLSGRRGIAMFPTRRFLRIKATVARIATALGSEAAVLGAP